jgi:hypothetical protein
VDYAIEQRRVILEKTQQSLGNWKKKFQEETAVNFPRSVRQRPLPPHVETAIGIWTHSIAM